MVIGDQESTYRMHVLLSELCVKYKVSKEFGFLLDTRGIELPHVFDDWKHINSSISLYIQDGSLRERIQNLKTIYDVEYLTYHQLRLAHSLAVTLTTGYIWCNGPDDAALVIPHSLAAPLIAISDKVGLPPVVCHASCCLSSWQLINPNVNFTPDNLQLRTFNLLGTRGNEWFFVLTAQIEKHFGVALYKILEAVLRMELEMEYETELKAAYHAMKLALTTATLHFTRMTENLTPCEFYQNLRQYMWGYTEGSLKDRGIEMEGFEHLGPFKHFGASAAQSSTIPLVEAFLDVKHAGAEQEFLSKQLLHMPNEHRQLIEWVRENTVVNAESGGEAREDVMRCLGHFRTQHMRMVSLFILTQKQTKDVEASGTGGSPFMKFLRNVREKAV